MVVGSVCYVSLFVALSLFTRRALLLGFGYVLIWEGALSNLLPGIANLSIRQYALGRGADLLRPGAGVGQAWSRRRRSPSCRSCSWSRMVLATRRLMRFEIAGGTD